MTPTKVHVLAAALLLALALASPAPQDKPLEAAPNQPQHPVHLQKRAAPQDSSPEQDLAAFKDLLVAQVAAELRRSWQEPSALRRTLVDEDGLEEEQAAQSKKKRMFAPLSGLPGELPTIKRQIRYHQCYFNPISCFRRK
ncbi:allatostatin isoform X1 [Penaeus vannamei]|uniref:allatostatin isoform X1 n=1 Tax=Penaeus vannamei TaxID=6689 RepID=UPI000F67289E|nr:allatostatin-like isoform X1 [Penaeus vannamei]